MLSIGGDNIRGRVTYGLVALNVLVFLVTPETSARVP